MRKEIALPVAVVLGVLAFVSIWTSMDFYAIGRNPGLSGTLNEYAYHRMIAAKIPPFFEILCFLLVAVLWHYGKPRETRWGKGEIAIVIFSFVAYILVLLNPNTPLVPVELLLDSLPILLFPLLLFSFLRLDDEYLAAVLKFLLSTAVWLAVVRGLWLFAWFLAGKGSHAFYKVNATLSEGDVLYFFAFLQLIVLGLYIALKEPKYLVASLVLFLIIILSFRRTWVALTLFGSLGLILTYIFMSAGFFKRVAVIASIVAVAYVSIAQGDMIRSVFGVYGDRYAAIFYAFRENPTTEGLGSDSGHQFESTYSMTIALSHLELFGVGLGGKFPTNLALSEWTDYGFHNVYADTLMRHGVVFLALLVCLVIYGLATFGRLLFTHAKVPTEYFAVRLSALVFLNLFFVVLFYNATWFKFDYAKFNFLMAPILVFVIRFRPDNYGLFLHDTEVVEETENSDEP
jgi:hypothetical protein